MHSILHAASQGSKQPYDTFKKNLCTDYSSSKYWGYYHETDPDPTATVIRVELFTHKPSETNTK